MRVSTLRSPAETQCGRVGRLVRERTRLQLDAPPTRRSPEALLFTTRVLLRRWTMEDKPWRTSHGGQAMAGSSGRLTPRRRYGAIQTETHNHVTMAATSSSMRERRYVMRKPLFSDHTSILTEPRLATPPEEERPVRRPDEDPARRRRSRRSRSSSSCSVSHSDMESRPNSDPDLKVCELAEQRDSSPFCTSSWVSGWSPPGTSTVPVSGWSPPGTSTVLDRGSGGSRRLAEGRRGGGEGRTTSYFSECPHRDNYWACALPRTGPPASDGPSPSGDPDGAYQALLDYCYPLRPGLGVRQWDTSGLQEYSHLQDSGIGLNRVDSPLSGSGLHCPTSRDHQRSPDLQGSASSAARSLPDPVASSLDSLDCSEDKGGWRHDSRAPLCSSTSFSSTRLLPQSRCVCREVDQEFWALPDRLEVLQLLSTQVRQVTAQVSWESVEPPRCPLLGSGAGGVAVEDNRPPHDGKQPGGGGAAAGGGAPAKPPPTPPAADLRGPGGAGGPLVGSGGLELEALGLRGSRGGQDQRDSLMQHIQVFCSHLELLIQHLYALSERTQRLCGSSVDMDSVTSALEDHQSAAGRQQPLSDGVLHAGKLLLRCIDSASPVLRDTLRLIELQSHSLLSSMDSILQSGEDAVELLQPHEQQRGVFPHL